MDTTNRTSNRNPMIFSPVIEMVAKTIKMDHRRNTNAKSRAQFFRLLNPYGIITKVSIASKTVTHISIERMEYERNTAKKSSTNMKRYSR